MKLNNKIMLITYADSLGNDLNELKSVVDKYYAKAVGGIHILPFFPSSADRGFAPMQYDQVDVRFGSFENVKELSKDYYLMFDFMVNHISRSSTYFNDFKEKRKNQNIKIFLFVTKILGKWEPTQEQVDKIYKRKPRTPYIEVEFGDGTKEKIWCTFDAEQVDLNVQSPVVKEFIKNTLINMCKKGASIIRLDAFAYAVKKANTSCFFVEPDIWNLYMRLKIY